MESARLQREQTRNEPAVGGDRRVSPKVAGPAVNSIDAGTPAIVHEVLRSPGQALDRSTSDFFESRLGHNFADVRVHTNEAASDSAREVGALAYTVGRNIVFGRDQFTPNTISGRQLIAHELAHVVQQSADSGSVPALQRWPVVRAEEMGTGGTDRFGSRTFDCGIYSVFIPAGAASVTTNRVHVFYSPGGAGAAGFTPGSNAVAVHGLRGAADPSQWIVIGVPDGRPNTISDAQIISCLTTVGRPGRLDSVRLSAHSRGAEGLVATLRGRHITPALIDHVTLLDINDFAGSINPALQRSHVPPGRVTSYNVIWGNFPLRDIHNAPLRGMHNIQVPFSCIRSIGYARLIRDAVATGRLTTPVPPDIAARVSTLTLPPRGSFSTATPTPPGRTSLRDFCADPANAAALTAMRDGEPPSPTSLLPPRVVTARATTSPYAFIEENNIMSFNNPARPRAQWDRFSPQIYSHHLFVAEIAHEMFP